MAHRAVAQLDRTALQFLDRLEACLERMDYMGSVEAAGRLRERLEMAVDILGVMPKMGNTPAGRPPAPSQRSHTMAETPTPEVNIIDILKANGPKGADIAKTLQAFAQMLATRPKAKAIAMAVDFIVTDEDDEGDTLTANLVAFVGNPHDLAAAVTNISTSYTTTQIEQQQEREKRRMLGGLLEALKRKGGCDDPDCECHKEGAHDDAVEATGAQVPAAGPLTPPSAD